MVKLLDRVRSWNRRRRADRKRFPTRWLSYTARVKQDVDEYLSDPEKAKLLDKDYVADFSKAIDQLEERQIKLYRDPGQYIAFYIHYIFCAGDTTLPPWHLNQRCAGPERASLLFSSMMTMLVGFMASVKEIKVGLPPEKWSSLRYGFEPCGGLIDVEEAA